MYKRQGLYLTVCLAWCRWAASDRMYRMLCSVGSSRHLVLIIPDCEQADTRSCAHISTSPHLHTAAPPHLHISNRYISRPHAQTHDLVPLLTPYSLLLHSSSGQLKTQNSKLKTRHSAIMPQLLHHKKISRQKSCLLYTSRCI